MSLYGISVKNKDGHSLISSDIETLHFGGLASYISTVTAQDNQIIGYSPTYKSSADIAQFVAEGAASIKPITNTAIIAAATAAGEAAITASHALDGTTVSGNVTTIRSTNLTTGFVTTTTITATTTVIHHPAVGATAAWDETVTSDVPVISVSTTSVKDAAYNAKLTEGQTQYNEKTADVVASYATVAATQNAAVQAVEAQALNSIGKSYVHTYSTSGVVEHAPLFFINPQGSLDSFGVLRQYFEGAVWKIEIIQSGDNPYAPRVLTFKRASEVTLLNSESYGLVTYLNTGAAAFDSRKGPLAILDAKVLRSPEIPCNGGVAPDGSVGLSGLAWNNGYYAWQENKLDFDFKCDQQKQESTPLSASIPREHIMFCAPALSEAVYSRLKLGYLMQKAEWFWDSDQAHRSRTLWWVMYHQTYSVTTDAISAGWCVYKSGYYATWEWDDAGWSGGGGAGQMGSAPYPNQTVNQLDNTVLISNASFYV